MTIMKRITVNNESVILFVCSPSLGILDSWIPVLIVLKNKLPDTHFVFLATKVGTIDQINLTSDLINMAQKVFNLVVFRSDSEILFGVKTFKDAEKLNKSSKINFFHYGLRLIKKFKFYKLGETINYFYKLIVSYRYSHQIYQLSWLMDRNYVTLFDLSQLGKPYNKDLYNLISAKKNFSILHGTGIAGIRTSGILTEKLNVVNSTAYLFSEKEIPYYESAFGLTRDQIKVYGIPKHQKEWIQQLSTKENIVSSKYIFLISRPTNESFSIGQRKVFLKMIKKIAMKYQLKIIIKLHPKEIKSNLYKEIFNSDEYKIEWEISNKHPYFLGQNCEFAVCFYSGVPLDLLQLGVPTIELSNLTGIDIDDNEYSLRDTNGKPVREYRYLNLVLGASTYNEFDKHVAEIMVNKKDLVMRLQENYSKFFPIIENVTNIIAEEIVKVIKN